MHYRPVRGAAIEAIKALWIAENSRGGGCMTSQARACLDNGENLGTNL